MMDRIKAIIADALYCDAQDVNPETNLMRDLGAESIDFLDIMFRLEKEFSIKIPKGEIERRAKGKLSDDQFAINGLLTEDGLQQLRLAMPEVDSEEILSGLYVRDIPTLFRVSTFERMVREQVASKSSAKSGVESPIGVATAAAN
jgi:acyl carrier protein